MILGLPHQSPCQEIRDLWQKHQEEHERDPTARTSHCGFVTFQHRRVAEMAQNLQISADLKDPPAVGPDAWESRTKSGKSYRPVPGCRCRMFLDMLFLHLSTSHPKELKRQKALF